MEPLGMLIDFTECIGCGECVKACCQQNSLTGEPLATDLSAQNFTVVLKHGSLFYRKLCMHCVEPTCVSVCPVAALTKSERGPVLYDPDRCMGCRYCMMACPFGVPRYQWNSPAPVIAKCIFCSQRVAAGGETACSWVCPMGATRMGERSHLLEIARARIAQKPQRYVDYIYGETDAGGTSVLMLSSVPFADLGFPAGLGREPLPSLTWSVLSRIPSIVVTGGVLLGGISWIINRRIQLEQSAGREKESGQREGGKEAEE
jgi:formate dehydrogenase iron-sulfur subunit